MKNGKVPENVLKRSVLRQIRTKREEVLNGAGVGVDCAVFSSCGRSTFLSCVQTAAVSAEAESGEMALTEPVYSTAIPPGQLILRCTNNLAAAGAEPYAVTLAFMLPEDTEEAGLKALMAEAEKACSALNIQIAGGQTCISSAVNQPVLTVTGYGKPIAEGWQEHKKISPGQDIVLSKWIGMEGTAILAGRAREGLLHRYPAYLVDEAACLDRWMSVIPEAATAVKSGVCAMHDVSEGGIFGALWELAERTGVGLTIDLKKIPLRQETVEVCEYCNVNPYELLSGGCLIMLTEDGAGLKAALEAEKIPAAVIGKVTDSRDRIIYNEDEVRYMDRPKNDEIYRWLQEQKG